MSASYLTYIEHLDIPIKYRGSILHSYEYNSTVDKINEIIDNLQVSYVISNELPKFNKIENVFNHDTDGVGTILTDNSSKLYPVTSSAYVIIDNEHTLDDTLSYLNSTISVNLTDVNDNITYIKSLIDTNKILSYAYTYEMYSQLNGYLIGKLNDEIGTSINDIDDKLTSTYAYIENQIHELSNNLTYLNSYFIDIIGDIKRTHSLDISDVISKIPHYTSGNGINISDDNEISVKLDSIVDNNTIYINADGRLVVNGDVILQDIENTLTFIDEHGNWVGGMSDVKNYIDDRTTKLDNKITVVESNLDKFLEYDKMGHNDGLSDKFISTQR